MSAVEAINSLQRRIVAGEDPSPEEMLAAINAVRAERGVASKASVEKKATKVKAAQIDLGALFGRKAPAVDGEGGPK